MGKPRMIILIRHAQSEGNKNREIHQMIPDHRVKLTQEGWKQAEEAGRRLRTLLKPDDTLQIFTSPYRRTRETTEGILKTLTAHVDPDDPTAPPSSISRSKIKVYEEPRLREQDFGNFQPCSAEMERMWKERADYGHFFYRIPNGESAADAYDRISGFNESLWRQFGDSEFPSVCVLVTHGLMTRVFLMKWYHWSVEYFEDLRNVNHCEFIVMKQNPENEKFVLQNQLRTWSELKRQRKVEQTQPDPQLRKTLADFLQETQESPTIPPRKWGGCVEGCNHGNELYPRREQQRMELPQPVLNLPAASEALATNTAVPLPHPKNTSGLSPQSPTSPKNPRTSSIAKTEIAHRRIPSYLRHGRDGGGTKSGAATPYEMSEDETAEFIDPNEGKSLARAMRRRPERKITPEDIERWANESGMGTGKRADALGDEPSDIDDEESAGIVDSAHSTGLEDIEEAERIDKGLRGSVY